MKKSFASLIVSLFATFSMLFMTSCGSALKNITKPSASKTVEVIWLNGDGSVLSKENVNYNSIPTVPEVDPVKVSSLRHWVFTGEWEPEVGKVTTNTTYYPVFEVDDEETFEVEWLKADGTLIVKDYYSYGEFASYNNLKYDPKQERKIPEKTPGNTVYYYFAGWYDEDTDEKPSFITKNTRFVPKYEELPRYEVKWYYEGPGSNSYWSNYCSERETPTYQNSTHAQYNYIPQKANKNGVAYSFAGWDPDPSKTIINKASSFTAYFAESPAIYQVKFKESSNSDTILYSTDAIYGSKVTYPYDVKPLADSVGYQRIFTGWNPSITNTTITKDTTFVAQYERKRVYTITYVIGNQSYSDTVVENKPTGYIVGKDRPEPYKASQLDDRKFVFVGWDKAFAPATSNTTYTARFGLDLKTGYYRYENSGTTTTVRWARAVEDETITVDGNVFQSIALGSDKSSQTVSIVVQTGIIKIAENAFDASNSSSPQLNITLPNTITRITKNSMNTYKGCSVLIPASVTTIEENAFNNDIVGITYQGTEADWNKINIADTKVKAAKSGNKVTFTGALNSNSTCAI